MIAIFERRSSSPMVLMSTPSITMRPASSSTMRIRHSTNELLPAPVRPTTPTFSPGVMCREICFSTGSSSGLYRIVRSSITTSPCAGHASLGAVAGMCAGASEGSSAYS